MQSDTYSVYEEYVKLVFNLMEAEKRIDKLEAALAERDKPCQCGIRHDAPSYGNRYCPGCGHPFEVAP